MLLCGVSEAFGDGAAQVKLPSSRVTFIVRDTLPGISRGDLEAACMEAWQRWARVCGITVDKHPNNKTDATQIVTVDNLGGPSGVLADQMLPYGSGMNLRMRLDSNEEWAIDDTPAQGKINLLAVLAHENGHCLGMQHFAPEGTPDLLNAIYTPKVFQPQEDDIAYARKLYGPPIVTTPPVPPGDYPAVVPCSIEFTIGGAKYRAQGNAKRVA
jgi:hypothetical protein